ncbi:MAG: spinster family MFS transporter [Hyphomonas sp.]
MSPTLLPPSIAANPQTRIRVTLWLLLIVNAFNFVDRQIVNILAEPIKNDLGLSDTQIGLMTGLAFAVVYTTLGIPIARWADNPKSNRVGIVAGSLAIWSGMTAVCGLAQNFWQLLLARIGVGVGEAGCTPASHSLIGDTVPPEKRGSAIAFFGLGIPIGSLFGMVIGGVLADAVGWRIAFMAVGIPGVLLAIVLWFLVKEPRKDGTLAEAAARLKASQAAPRASIRETITEVLGSKVFIYATLGASFVAFLGYGKGVWNGIFLIRTHGLSLTEVGLLYGVSAGLGGMAGTWLGGWTSDKFGIKKPVHYMLAPAVAMLLTVPILLIGYAGPVWVAIPMLCISAALSGVYYAPTFGCVQLLISPASRAVAVSLMLFTLNLIGLGLGPLVFGILSDRLEPIAGTESVRWSLYVAGCMGVIPTVLYWLASKNIHRELAEKSARDTALS